MDSAIERMRKSLSGSHDDWTIDERETGTMICTVGELRALLDAVEAAGLAMAMVGTRPMQREHYEDAKAKVGALLVDPDHPLFRGEARSDG